VRIKVRLPRVDPERYEWPVECPYKGCDGRRFKAHGIKGETKAIRDPQVKEVATHRRRCLKCGRTFRVYPRGVSGRQQSERLQAISVLLYVLGLSYGGVEDFLEAIGAPLGKTTVYTNVQEAGVASRQRQREELASGGRRLVIGSDGTYVKVKGEIVGVQVVVDDEDSDLLSLEIISSENAEEVRALVEEVAQQVGAEVLVSDDLDTYKRVADELDLGHQICRSHVKRNVDALAEELSGQLAEGEQPPEGVGISPGELVDDLQHLRQLIRERPEDGEEQLAQLYHRYRKVRQPSVGEKHTTWQRMRLLITRLWDRWPRLTLDQRRDDLDGTNNSSERMIGWWAKERYRTMRGYKRRESIRNVVTLTARMGARSGFYDMAELYT